GQLMTGARGDLGVARRGAFEERANLRQISIDRPRRTLDERLQVREHLDERLLLALAAAEETTADELGRRNLGGFGLRFEGGLLILFHHHDQSGSCGHDQFSTFLGMYMDMYNSHTRGMSNAVYHRSRTHLGLHKDAPEPRPIHRLMSAESSRSPKLAACTIVTSDQRPEGLRVARGGNPTPCCAKTRPIDYGAA